MSNNGQFAFNGDGTRAPACGRDRDAVSRTSNMGVPPDYRVIVDELAMRQNLDPVSSPDACGNAMQPVTMDPHTAKHDGFRAPPVAVNPDEFRKSPIDDDQPPLVAIPDRHTAIDDVVDSVALAAVDEILLAMQGKGDPRIQGALETYRKLGETALSLNPFVKDPQCRVEEIMHRMGELIFRNFRGRSTRSELGSECYLRFASRSALGELELASSSHALNEPVLWRERLAFDRTLLYACIEDDDPGLFPPAEPVGTVVDRSDFTGRLNITSVTCVTETPDDVLGTSVGTDDFEARGTGVSTVRDALGGLISTSTIEAKTYTGQFDTGDTNGTVHIFLDIPINATPGALTTFNGRVTPTESDLTGPELAKAIGQVADLLVSLGVSVAASKFRMQVASADSSADFRNALQMLIDSGLVPDNAVRQLEGLGGLLERALAPETFLGYRIRARYLNSRAGGAALPNWSLDLEFRMFDPTGRPGQTGMRRLTSETAIASKRPPQDIFRNRPVVLQQFSATNTSSGQVITQQPGQYQVRHQTILVDTPQTA